MLAMVAMLGCGAATGRGAASSRTSEDRQRGLEPAALDASESERGGTGVAARDGGPHAELTWLSPRRIAAAVGAHSEAFNACQALGDLHSRRRDGAVTVGWLVEPDGSVHEVTVGPSTVDSDGINACVLSVAKKVTFPPSPAPTHVSWTVKFRGSMKAALAGASPR